MLAISDRATLAEGGLPAWLASLAAAGIEAVQLREKDLPDRDLLAAAREARATLGSGVRLLVNGRVDVALAAGADGVHLPADGVPIAPLRRRFGRRLWIGRSTHRLAEIEAARDAGAEYVTFGPVLPVPGKGEPVGFDGLARASRLDVPVLALGGITEDHFADVAAAGAAGVAAIRLFQDPARLPEVVAALRACFSEVGTSTSPARIDRGGSSF